MEIEGFGTLTRMGTGGLGDVYRATRLSTGAPVAIKVLRDWSDSSTSWHRARRELKALVDLQGHPNVVHVEEVVEMDGVPLLVMEFAPGGSVADLLGSKQRLSLGDTVLVGEQTAAALAASHQLGIIHLDIKPQNLLIGSFGQVKVCDFGIAALTQTEQFKTRTSAVSYRYASPEQLNDEPTVGAPADMFSLGATLAHLANGVPLPVVTGDGTRTRRPFTYTPVDPAPPAEALAVFEDFINECLRVGPGTRPTAVDAQTKFAEISTMLGDQRSRALPVVASTAGAGEAGQMVPRVVTSPTSVSGPIGATIPRSSLPGAPVPGGPVTGPPTVDPTVVSQPYGYMTGPPGVDPGSMSQPYGYVTQTGQGVIPVMPPQQQKRGGAAIAAVIASVAAVVALAAVGFVMMRGDGEDAASASSDRRDDTSPAAEQEEAAVQTPTTIEQEANVVVVEATTTTTPPTTVPVVAVPSTEPAPTTPPAPAALPWEELFIGTASGGTPIVAYHGGTPGGVPVMVVGGLQPHRRIGEAIGYELLSLEIPAGVEMWVVPRPVPDGDSTYDRRSYGGVDINRNFPTDWAPIKDPSDPNYQGVGPASEVETRAIIDLAEQVRPVWEVSLLGPANSDFGLSYDSGIEDLEILYNFHDHSGLSFDQDAGSCVGSSDCYGTMTQYMNSNYGSAFTAILPDGINREHIARAIMLTAADLVE